MESLNPENSSMQELDDSGCVQDASGSRNSTHLLDLCDDVLLCILKYLSPRDLKALGHTCPRLGIVVCDRMLWTKVDARTNPVGQRRLKWFLTHCLSSATVELKVAGYANKFSRCLGVQDLQWPVEADQDFIRGTCVGSQEGVDVEHFLLRMWYPHLPRFTVSPRWPDKAEAEIKKAKALEAAAAINSGEKIFKPSYNQNHPAKQHARIHTVLDAIKNADPTHSAHRPGCIPSNSRNRAARRRNPRQGASNSNQNQGNSSTKVEENSDYPYLFEEDFTDDCKGPQFTLTTDLMRQLRKTCSNLSFLALEYCNLDYKMTNLRHFPLHLKQLSLRGSRCYNLPLNTSYLGKVQERLPELEYLDVSECDWFEPASLMPLSKLPNLTELYMRDCKRLTECVAYASLATRYGFRKLRVFDVRGSPLADSEVSALGWLPCLEELYVAPPEDFNTVTEHTHSWHDIQTEFDELDSWELEEPDYYKIKSPEPVEDEDEKDEEPDNERTGDNLLNNPWWSHERRIIVIQPNANRQLEERLPFVRDQEVADEQNRPAQPRAPRPGERGPEGILPEPQPGPAEDGPAVPPLPTGYRRIGPIRCGSIDILPAIGNPRPTQREHVLEEPRPGPATPRPGPVTPRPVPSDPREGLQGSNPKNPRPSTSKSHNGPSTSGKNSTNQVAGPSSQPGSSNPQQGPSSQPGSSNPQQGPSNQPDPSAPEQGPSKPQPAPASAVDGSKRRISLREAVDIAKRRRVDMNEDDDDDDDEYEFEDDEEYEFVGEDDNEEMDNSPPVNPELCPRLRPEAAAEPQNGQPRPGFVRYRRHDLRPIMHIDVDINRQSTIHIGTHVGYHLVSDSALLRFGRAINENVNYVHIGRHGIHTGSDSGSRPDRSNLRILSVTGYRNITDRSLEHLVTAAPHLLHIDFSETNVTPRGVELFKAVRPDCDVIYSEFGRLV